MVISCIEVVRVRQDNIQNLILFDAPGNISTHASKFQNCTSENYSIILCFSLGQYHCSNLVLELEVRVDEESVHASKAASDRTNLSPVLSAKVARIFLSIGMTDVPLKAQISLEPLVSQ